MDWINDTKKSTFYVREHKTLSNFEDKLLWVRGKVYIEIHLNINKTQSPNWIKSSSPYVSKGKYKSVYRTRLLIEHKRTFFVLIRSILSWSFMDLFLQGFRFTFFKTETWT